MMQIPFLRPCVVPPDSYRAALDRMQATRIYSNFGPLNTEFEQRLLQELLGGEGAVTTVANATLGLMLAIQACRRPSGRLAIMPSFTFAATPLAAQWCGLQPYFLDVAPGDWCMAAADIEQAVARLGDQVAVVVGCCTFGADADLSVFQRLLDRGVPVVIDAAAGLGTTRDGRPLGAGFPGAIVYSLHATKTFAVGEGGVIYSHSPALIAAIRQAENFGFGEQREATMLGMNAKMCEMLAAVALATLDQLPEKAAYRRGLANGYREEMTRRGWLQQGWSWQTVGEGVSPQFFPLLAPEGAENIALIARAESAGVQIRRYFSPPCHRQAQFAACPKGDLGFTFQLERRVLSLPLWEEMELRHIQQVLDTLEQARLAPRSAAHAAR